MQANKDIEALKKKVYLTYHQDGIIDLTAATILLGFSIFMATDNVVFLALGAFCGVEYALLKQRITIPRLGYVRFEPKEKSLRKNLVLLGIGMLVLFLVFAANAFLTIDPSSFDMQRYHMVPLSVLLFALPALVAAILLGLKRFYLYALLAAVLPALGAWLNIETFIPILVTGLVILVTGLWLLAGFIKQYPVMDSEGEDVNG